MSKKLPAFKDDGTFSHWMKKGDAAEAVREGQAQLSCDGSQILLLPKILQCRGKLGVWAAVRCSDPRIPRVEGLAPKFSTMQLL